MPVVGIRLCRRMALEDGSFLQDLDAHPLVHPDDGLPVPFGVRRCDEGLG